MFFFAVAAIMALMMTLFPALLLFFEFSFGAALLATYGVWIAVSLGYLVWVAIRD